MVPTGAALVRKRAGEMWERFGLGPTNRRCATCLYLIELGWYQTKRERLRVMGCRIQRAETAHPVTWQRRLPTCGRYQENASA